MAQKFRAGLVLIFMKELVSLLNTDHQKKHKFQDTSCLIILRGCSVKIRAAVKLRTTATPRKVDKSISYQVVVSFFLQRIPF